jgi:hypothetical protein
MNMMCLTVTPRGRGYVAECTSPKVTALGASPGEALESARAMVWATAVDDERPTTAMLRFREPGREIIVLQPAGREVTDLGCGFGDV